MSGFVKQSVKAEKAELPSRFLYVAGIGQQLGTLKIDVLEVFGAYGVVEKVDFIPNKRFCFITFEEVESAMLAKKDLEKNEVDRFKTKLLIKFAEEEVSKEAVPEPDCTSTTADVIVPGLELIRDFLSVEDEELILSSRFGGPSSPMWIESISRRIQHFGFTFNYRTLMLDFNSESTPPFPPEFVNLARCIASYDCKEMNSVNSKCSPFSESFPISIREELTQLTLNEYYPGQGIASHIDTESVFGPDIFIISVGSGVTMTMTQQRVVPATSEDDIVGGEGDEEDTRCKKKKHVYLYPRSLLVMRGDSRYLWSHTITPRKSDKIDGELIQRGRRVSLTFRQALIPGDIPGTRLSSSAVEREHVYRVYDSIATHWHHTRGKRKVHWHRVKAFIEGLEEGSLIADIGSGDGKYFGLNASAFSIGCDRSIRLLEVSADQRHETFCCDAVKVPLRSDVFDAVLCIAVLHHIATVDRRVAVIRELLRVCRPGGSVMLQAWALEQENTSKRNFEEQDVLVPWRLQKHFQSKEIACSEDSAPPEGPCTHVVEENGELVFQRYCHVYKRGELEDLCSRVPGLRLIEVGFDRSNWFVHFEKINDERVLALSSVGPTAAIPDFHYRNRDQNK